MKLPYVDFALVQERTSAGLKMKVMGTIYSPQGKTPKAWMVDADLLKEKTFMVIFDHFYETFEREIFFFLIIYLVKLM